MKFCFVLMKGAFRRHCLLIQWGLRLVLRSIPWHISGCLSSALLLYLGKDISRVQLFPLINTALGRPLLRLLLRKCAHSENLLPGMYQISAKCRIQAFFNIIFQIQGLFLDTFLEVCCNT